MASKCWTLLPVCLAIFMLLLDITIVNVALPDIRRDLDSSFTDLQWVVYAYALALAALLLATGSLGDLLGRRRIFVLGILLSRPTTGPLGWPASSLAASASA